MSGKDLFHLRYSHAASPLSILLHQDVVKSKLIKEHLGNVNLITEHLVWKLASLIRVQFVF